ncbi:MAG: 4-hydroxythreonine-4-phosphate dehydrogenase PdxA [candidate division WOR-3 bacterium]
MLGITIGDPSGIGPEITLKSLVALAQRSSIRVVKNFIIIGNRALLTREYKKFIPRKIKFNFDELIIADAFEDFIFRYGRVQKECGIASILELNFATYLLKTKQISGLITAPVCKQALQLAGFPFAGQTEYFATEFGVKDYGMLIWTRPLKIILATIHLPLRDVSQYLTVENIYQKILLLNNFLKTQEKLPYPRIGILAFNPHGFEFSRGEEAQILQAIKKARRQKIRVEGPIPADSAFSFSKHQYDGYVAMYHDQALLASKLLAKGVGVNLTVGLPFIRTAPLHGVAFDIAGLGVAQIDCMLMAINLAKRLIS